jgi:gas vesicle protein
MPENPKKKIDTEEKSVDDESKEKELYYAPYGVTSFEEFEEYEEIAEKADETRRLTWVFQDLVQNILMSDDELDKGAMLSSLVEEYQERIQSPVEKQFGRSVIYKSGDTYRFLGVYSNNFIDRENDILTAKSHEEFASVVEKNEWPYPELRYHHIPVAIGQSDGIYYDESSGMAIATGYFHKEFSEFAEDLSKVENLGMSHGMPKNEIVYDSEGAISRYRSKEISVLPLEKAANILTQFSKTEEPIMNDKLRKALEGMGFNDESVEKYSTLLGEMGSIGKDAGLVSKEKDDEPPEATEETPENEEASSTDEPEEKAHLTPDQLSEVLKTVVKELRDEFSEKLKEFTDKIQEEQTLLVKSMVANRLAGSPTSSVGNNMLKEIFGSDTSGEEFTTPVETNPNITKSTVNPHLPPFMQQVMEGTKLEDAMKGSK